MKWSTRERPKIDRIACPRLMARLLARLLARPLALIVCG